MIPFIVGVIVGAFVGGAALLMWLGVPDA